MSLAGKTLFITGASRGIGKAIALKAAADGANIVIVAKTTEPHPRLPGTIYSAAAEVESAGGKALAMAADIRDSDQITAAADRAVDAFGSIDVLVNNASAISLTGTLATPLKRFDLMFSVNVRGAFACSQACIPHLAKAANPHILNLAPPLNMDAKWFEGHVAYTMAKYGMSMCTLGMSAELKRDGIAVNSLWPRTAIDTAALRMLGGAVRPENCRTPDIVADAAHVILCRDSRAYTGNFFIDDAVLAEAGISDLDRYKVAADGNLFSDFFVDT